MTGAGLPHSETCGSKSACLSPQLIAAYRVLRRLVMPRHPSCARIRLAEDRNPRHLVTLQFFFPDYAVVKELPRRSGEIRLCAETLRDWWACLESNQGPRPYQGRALTN